MTSIKLTTALLAITALSACEGGIFGNKDSDGAGDAALGGISQSALDPTSIAYFNETIGDTVLFAVDQSTLSAEGIEQLNRQSKWLLDNMNNAVTIEGHADEQGTREYNLALSARRATAVQNYLVSRGLTDARLSVVPYGKQRPLAECSDEACWSKNRRAVTVVSGGLGS